MQPNQWQQPSYGYGGGGFQSQQSGFQSGGQSGLPNQSYLSSQPTGYPMQQQQQPLQTGFNARPPPSLQAAPTGAPGGNYSFLNQPPPSFNRGGPMTSSFTGGSGLAPQMTGYPAGGASGLLSQPTGFQSGMMSQPNGMGGLMSQPTGMGRLQAQPTGMPHDPRLQTMMQSFMPSNMSQPFLSSGVPQFNPTPQSQPLSQTFQSLLQNPTVETPKVPWTISRQEKKDYDQIFRAWDTKGDGFIMGDMAREVFGQSGLGQDDLMKIWNLSDVDNRGKLNLPEFHVAMGLIYRALNGNRIPNTLPEEMVPPSMRDIDTTVTFMRDLLKHEASTRSNTSSPSYGNTPVGPQSKDAKVYKHDDTRPSGYKSSSRHLDRKSVRYAGEDSNADISDIRRQLTNTSALLDRQNDDYARKSEEDEALEQELDDLKYRVKRIQEDIEYVSRGKRTSDKDEERRKLERELLFLMHEKLPELERRQEEREEEKRREERQGTRARDRRNETHGRYGDYDREEDRGYMRGTFDRRDDRRDRDSRDSRDREYDRDRYDRSRDRSRDRDDRYRGPPAAREAPPTPAAPPKTDISVPPPPPPAPTPSTTAPSTKNMTPEERSAFIRAEAQRRIQERLKALGVEPSPAETPSVDNSVQERLNREKQEAEEKSKAAEKEQEAREDARKKRLEGSPEEKKPAAPPVKSALKKAPAPPPAPPASRNKAPPPAPISRNSSAPAPPPPQPTEDPEEVELRQREEARQKAIADRKARLKALEEEEEEERKKEEAILAARKNRSAGLAPPMETPTPPAPSAPSAPTSASGGSYNPFKRNTPSSGTTAAPAAGGFNPFFKPPVAEGAPAPTETAPPPPPAPAPPPPPFTAPPRQASVPPPEEDWDVIQEKQLDSDDDSSDEEYASSRNKRGDLARALFGNILPQTTGSNPSSRPGSTAPPSAGIPPPPPGPPKATPAALANLGGGDAAPQSRGALFAAIQGGAKLRKAQTVDKSGPAVSGKIIGGDPSPPPARYQPPPSPSPEPLSSAAPGSSSGTSLNFDDAFIPPNPNRQSVDWYAGLAADTSHPSASADSHLESFNEEKEDEEVHTGNDDVSDDLSDFDLTKEIRVRTLFPYDGQRDVDLSFIENVVITAHPAKDSSSPWWYGTLVKEGRKGWFPHSYVEEIHVSHAKALYTYAGGGEEELPFAEGDTIAIIDKSDENWWKTEKAGVVFIVPASYLETIDTTSPVADLTDDAEPNTASRPIPFNVPVPADESSFSNSSTHVASIESPSMLSPIVGSRPRSSTVTSTGSGDESSDDSVLSWWDSDDSDDDEEPDAAKDKARDDEKKRREIERQKVLASAGLKLRREPPGIPNKQTDRKVSRKRRAPPAAPTRTILVADHPRDGSKDLPPAPLAPSLDALGSHDDEYQEAPELQTQDAYARYEAYLQQAQSRPAQRRRPSNAPAPRPMSEVLSTDSQTSLQLSPSSSTSGPQSGGRISGFLSRMMAPTPSIERKPTPTISGPISRVASDSTGDENGENFGQTWSSLVEPSVLETMSTKERKRQEAIFEFIATETTYNRDLQLIVEVFYASMLDMLDEKALTVIFANIEDILLFNTSFLSSLEQRQKSCRLYIDVIGDVLEQHISSISVYLPYCVNQQQAIRLLQSLRQSKPELDAHLKSIRENNPSVRGLDLSSFLLIPMQRLTRYPLLLKQIIHYTEPDQDLKAVESAHQTAEGIVASVNESVREAEGLERLRILSEDLWIGGEGRLDLTAPTAYQGSRRLLKEGSIQKSKSGRKLQMILCNDILVLIESRNLYRMPIPLHELSARETRDETSFQLKLAHQRGGDTIGLKASSAKEAQAWLKEIVAARNTCMQARNEVVRRSRASSLGGGF